MIRLTVLILVFGIFTPTLAAEPKTYTAKFSIYQDGDKVGGSTKELSLVSDNTYRLRTSSSAKIFFVKLRYKEDAIFTWENDKAKPQSYLQSSDTSFSSERKTVQTFNWPTMTETGTYKDRSWDIELSDDSHSRLTDIVQFQEILKQSNKPVQSITFLVHDRGSSKNESFQFEAEEFIQTPSGEYKTWRYRKTHNNPKRQSLFWFATELDFFPVRVQQFKDGEEQANMMLREIEFD